MRAAPSPRRVAEKVRRECSVRVLHDVRRDDERTGPEPQRWNQSPSFAASRRRVSRRCGASPNNATAAASARRESGRPAWRAARCRRGAGGNLGRRQQRAREQFCSAKMPGSPKKEGLAALARARRSHGTGSSRRSARRRPLRRRKRCRQGVQHERRAEAPPFRSAAGRRHAVDGRRAAAVARRARALRVDARGEAEGVVPSAPDAGADHGRARDVSAVAVLQRRRVASPSFQPASPGMPIATRHVRDDAYLIEMVSAADLSGSSCRRAGCACSGT